MSRYIREEDLKVYKENQKKIDEEAERKRLEVFEPTKTERDGYRNVIFDFLKKTKRKLYGGEGQNQLIKAKDPKDAIYGELVYRDIEFYSPDPIRDCIALCDELYSKGYKHVQSREADHPETFKIFVNFEETCDISYVPRNIYNRIPYEEVNGMWITSPSFMFINVLRVMTDMLSSVYRVEKDMERGYLMQKHYPMHQIRHAPSIESPDKTTVKYRENILQWCTGRESTVQIGEFGCFYYENRKLASASEVHRLDFISTNFAQDCWDLYHYLVEQVSDKVKLTTQEYYPFMEYTGHRFSIWYDGKQLVQVFSYNKRCTPYRDLKYGNDSFLRMGTFSLVLMYNYLLFHMARVNKDKDDERYWHWQIQTIIEARNNYLREKKKNIYDNTPYQEFKVQCVGKTVDPIRAYRLRKLEMIVARSRGAAKASIIYRYNPEEEHEFARRRAERASRDGETSYKTLKERQEDLARRQFFNTSGNPVMKERNLKVRLDQPRPSDVPTLSDAEDEDWEEESGSESDSADASSSSSPSKKE
jgi:hypothetical protein